MIFEDGKKAIDQAIRDYGNEKYNNIIEKLEELEKTTFIYEDPYILGYMYALLVCAYLKTEKDYDEKIVNCVNKILLISGKYLFEYTGNYSPFDEYRLQKVFKAYECCIGKNNPDACWGKARILILKKEFKEAEFLFKKAIEIDSNNYYAYCMYGRFFEFQFKYSEAEMFFLKAIDIDAKNPTAYQMLAYIYQNMYEIQKAEKYFLKSIQVDDKDSRGYLRLSFFYKNSNSNKWKEVIEKAITLDPNNSKILTSKAMFISSENKENSKELYSEIIKNNPYSNMALKYEIDLFDNFYDKQKNLKKAIRLNKYDYELYKYYINAIYYEYPKENNIQETEKKLRKWCISLIKNHFQIYCKNYYIEECRLHYYIGDLSFNIIDELTQLKENDFNNPELYFLLGQIYENIGEIELAKDNYKKANTIDIYNINYLYCLGFLETRKHNYNEAITYFDKALLFDKKNITIKLNKLSSECYLGKYNNKTELIKKINEINRNNSLSDFEIIILGELAYREKLFELSLKILKKIKDNSDEYKFVILLKIANYHELKDKKKEFNEIINSKILLESIFSSLLNVIDMFKDEIDIRVLENIYIKNNYSDKIFNQIIEKYDSQYMELLNRLWFWECTLQSLLTYQPFEDNKQQIAHYTTKKVLDALILSKEPEKNTESNFLGKIWLSTITPANDPKEGKILIDLLNTQLSQNKLKYLDPQKFAILQTSMTLCEDSLTMLRFYGKEENIEGSGVNICFKNSYFSYYTKSLISSSNNQSLDKQKNSTKRDFYLDDRMPLYWVLYYDSKNDYLLFNPSSKYESEIINISKYCKKWNKLNPPVCNYKCNHNCLRDKKCNSTSKYYKSISENIEFSISKIINILENIQSKNDIELNRKAEELLCYIKYLFKDAAFSDEQELRLLSLSTMNSENMFSFDNRLYKEYFPLTYSGFSFINKIILGPNVKNCNVMVEYYRHIAALSKKDIAIYKSHAPFSIVNNQGVKN